MNKFISKYLGDRAFWSSALRLAIPIAAQNLLMSSFTIVDTLMIGQLGDIELSSVGMAGQWSWLMGLVMFGLNSGASVFISQYWGVRDIKNIRGIFAILLWHTLGVSAIFAAVGFFAPNTVVSIFNDTPEIVAAGASYLTIAAFSYFGIALNNVFSTLLRSTENVKLPMYASAVSTVVNAILDYGLIFGAFGLPAMGIEGAALATVISSWIAPIIVLVVSIRQKNMLIMRFREFFTFGKALLFKFYRISSPVVFNESMWGLGTMLYNVIFARLGYENYAAITILRTVEGVPFVFFVGLCNACCVMVGKNIGRGEREDAIRDARRFAVLVPITALLLGLGVVALRPLIITMYSHGGNLTDVTVNAAMGILLIYGLEMGMKNIPYIQIVGIFRSGGDTKTGVKYDLVCLWLISLPLTFLSAFVFKLPFIAVYAVMLLAEDTLKVFLCLRHFISRKWIKPLTEQGIEAASVEAEPDI
ncbi:MAG: MATE family efflux transporter [Eubacteriales bacterium]